MDSTEIVRRLKEATVEMYQLGLTFTGSMIPPIPENCTSLPAGPVRFVVEVRHLTDAAVAATMGKEPTGEATIDDYGGTVHVYGSEDGLEHLRFDCFDGKPHYHYANNAEGRNTVCRIDQHAEGDPIQWTLGRLRDRLPDMLDYAGVPELAALVRQRHDEVVGVVDDVEKILRQAQDRARAEWATV